MPFGVWSPTSLLYARYGGNGTEGLRCCSGEGLITEREWRGARAVETQK
jgi:hypothetical protein